MFSHVFVLRVSQTLQRCQCERLHLQQPEKTLKKCFSLLTDINRAIELLDKLQRTGEVPPQKLQALQRVLQSEFCNAVREVRHWKHFTVALTMTLLSSVSDRKNSSCLLCIQLVDKCFWHVMKSATTVSLQVYEHVYETVDINSSPEVRANATAKVDLSQTPFLYTSLHRPFSYLNFLPAAESFTLCIDCLKYIKFTKGCNASICSFVGYCGCFCSKRGSLTSTCSGAAEDGRRLGIQHNGWKGAKLAYLHLTDHPRRHR